MSAILQYTLNLNKRRYKYKGRGTVYITGSSYVIFKPTIGTLVVKFGINEYSYDTDHHVWKIRVVYGTPSQVYYIAYSGYIEKIFKEEELIKFNDASIYFNNKYQFKINVFAKNINYIQEIIDILPTPPSPEINLITAKFNFGDYVYDKNHEIRQIISVFHHANDVFYEVANKDKILTSIFSEIDLISFEESSAYFNKNYKENINLIIDKIDHINNLLATIPVGLPEENIIIIKFNLNEYVYDENENIWKIVSVENIVDRIQYVAERNNIKKIFDQDSLVNFNEKRPYFSDKYEDRISSYANKLANIQSIINSKYG